MLPTPTELGLLEIAAELRVTGKSWATVAARVERSEETCRHWPVRFADEWNRLFLAAQGRVINDIGLASFIVLRQTLDSADQRLRQDTAKFMARMTVDVLKEAVRAAKQGDGFASYWISYLQALGALNENQQRAFHFDTLAEPVAEETPVETVPAGGAGPAVGE